MGEYDDMIDLKRPISLRHPPMSRDARAAQFGAFAALRGYDDTLDETARYTDEKLTLDSAEIEQINRTLLYIEAQHITTPVKLTYFRPDTQKSGGRYITATAIIHRIDRRRGALVLADGGTVLLQNIYRVEL